MLVLLGSLMSWIGRTRRSQLAALVVRGLASALQTQSVVDPELLQAVVDAEAAAEGHGGEEGDDVDGDAWR